MSTERIFGGWHTYPTGHRDELTDLWHKLAEQGEGKPNFGLSQKRPQITMLWSLFQRARPAVICEVGTSQGGSLAGWCQLATWPCTIIAIDRDLNDCRPRPGEPVHPSIYSGPLAYTSQKGGACSLVKPHQIFYGIQGWSYEPATVDALKHVLKGRQIDFLFHDASHSAVLFEKDWNLYWPLIADGGIFAMHDIQPAVHPDCNKSEYYEKVKARDDYSALFEFRGSVKDDSMGIAAILK